MTTFATLFSGGELYGVGARNAGLTHLWGIEYKDDIAAVARLNGFNVLTSDVMTIDPTTLESPDLLHASPVCKRASVVNQSGELNEYGTKETLDDIDAGLKVAQFIDVLKPKFVTIENVYAYRKFRAFKIICAALDRGGYWWDYDNLNAADFGVPQSRRRLILRASRVGLLPNLPAPLRWVGWYEAIEDLIPTLPESQFAPWQLARLPEEIKGVIATNTVMLNRNQSEREDYLRLSYEPAYTVCAEGSNGRTRAFIVDGQNAGRPLVVDKDEPVFTVTNPYKGVSKAWLSQGRVVKMNLHALSRFQSLPDSYIGATGVIIGNGVPCKLAEIITKHLT